MALETLLQQSIDANNALRNVVDGKIADIDARVASAQAQVDGFIRDGQAQWPFVNLLKNFRALDVNGDGIPDSPLGFYTNSSTTFSQRVIATADAPSFVQDLIAQSALGVPDVFKQKANVIEVTLSRNGGTGFFMFLPGRYVHGRASAGAAVVAADGGDVTFYGYDTITAGTGVINLVQRTRRSWNIDMLVGEVSGDNVRVYVFMPFVCAGYLPDGHVPLMLFDQAYYIYN